MEKISSNVMFEMMGRPPEHLEETMRSLIGAISAEKGISVKNSKVHPAKKIDNKDVEGKVIAEGELFSTFAEVEVETENLLTLLSLIFRYMPSHIEVIYPEKFSLANVDFNLIINQLIARLHNYDAVAKGALMNNQLLAKKLEGLMQNSKPGAMPLEISYGNKEKKTSKKKKN
jgi:hypothetical protein